MKFERGHVGKILTCDTVAIIVIHSISITTYMASILSFMVCLGVFYYMGNGDERLRGREISLWSSASGHNNFFHMASSERKTNRLW